MWRQLAAANRNVLSRYAKSAASPSLSLLSLRHGAPMIVNASLGTNKDINNNLQQQVCRRNFSTPPPPPPRNWGGINVMNPQQQQQQQSYLEQFGIDLTAKVRKQLESNNKNESDNNNNNNSATNKMTPIIGRHDEIRRCLQILGRRTKNNPILIGEAGVGKTAIAEGLAQRIVSGQVPESIKDKRIISLDVASIVSGTMMRGQFEERIQGILQEVSQANGEIILFIDEIHTIVGTGGSSELDMSNMLKPALARGDLQLLGATTIDEYRKVIEKDVALARRFQSVFVKEPNVQDTLSILRGIKSTYELHHSGIRIKDEALIAAVSLSNRYITDRYQPDKSIDLIDEACSKLRLEQESKPEKLWQLERDLLTKQIEESALDNEQDDNNKELQLRKQQVKKEVQELKKHVEALTGTWQNERQELNRIKDVKEELAKAQADLDHARRHGDYTKAGEILHSTIPALEQELQQLEQAAETNNKDNNSNKSSEKMLQDAVTAQAIATIVARHTGIPVERINGSDDESKKLLRMEQQLRKRVVGQDHALEIISDCVRLARTRLQAQDRTLGNFLFLGPSGVGKTELCKALAEFMFDDQDAMTRIDMSEYGEKHTVSRLIGAPPGYVGYDDGGGMLTESVRRRPYQVVLFDEFEKGHKDVWNVLLQLFDEGHVTDSHGRKVDFRNVVVVMTSNMGANIIADLPSHIQSTEPQVQEAILDVVRQTLSPELINRIDDMIVFNRLQRDSMDQIVSIGIDEISNRLQQQHQLSSASSGGEGPMTLDISQSAKDCIAEKGYDIRYGARPLKRVLTRDLLNPLSRALLEGTIQDGDVIQVRTRGEAMILQKKGLGAEYGWISSNPLSENKNDIVILKNHKQLEQQQVEEEEGDEEVLQLDDDEEQEVKYVS